MEFLDETAGSLRVAYPAAHELVVWKAGDENRFAVAAAFKTVGDRQPCARAQRLWGFIVPQAGKPMELALRFEPKDRKETRAGIHILRVHLFTAWRDAQVGRPWPSTPLPSPVVTCLVDTPSLTTEPPGTIYLTAIANAGNAAPIQPLCGQGLSRLANPPDSPLPPGDPRR